MSQVEWEKRNGFWVWPKAEEKALARFVLDGCRRWLRNHPLEAPPAELNRTPGGRRELIRSLYVLLQKYEIVYALEQFSDDKRAQLIRTPPLILENPKEGTCLDLSLLFCGLCLDCGLIPWIVLLEGHAYVMVSLEHNLTQVDAASRKEIRDLFAGRRLVTQPEIVNRLLDDPELGERFWAVECTGFVNAKSLNPNLPEAQGRDEKGMLPFELAVKIGGAHLKGGARKLACAIDIGVARWDWGISSDLLETNSSSEILSVPAPPVAPVSVQELGVLPYLCDRVEQSDEVFNLVLDVVGQETSRPLLFLIPGDQDQHHNGLIRRLSNYDIPRAVAASEDEPAVAAHAFDLPAVDPAQFDLRLRRSLAKKLCDKADHSPSWARLTERLERRAGPTLLFTTYDTSQWDQDRKAGFDRIDALLKSWENCGDLPVRRAAIVCVQVVVESPPTIVPDPAEAVRGFLDALRPRLATGTEYPGVVARCLEPLRDVGRVHLDSWWQEDLVREFSDDHDFTEEVNALFADASKLRNGRLPMSRVVPQLEEWLKPFAGRS